MTPTEKIVTPWGIDCAFYDKSDPSSGRLYTSEEGKEVKSQAIVSPELMLSKIAQGFDEEKAGLLKGDAKPLVTAICLNYLHRRKAFCNDEREQKELETQVAQLIRAGGRGELVEAYFKSISRTLGARGVAGLAKLMETVERKSRALTAKEKHFIQDSSLVDHLFSNLMENPS